MLAAAKRAVKILNSIWASLERPGSAMGQTSAINEKAADDETVEQLTNKVSKLNLKIFSHHQKTKMSNLGVLTTSGSVSTALFVCM